MYTNCKYCPSASDKYWLCQKHGLRQRRSCRIRDCGCRVSLQPRDLYSKVNKGHLLDCGRGEVISPKTMKDITHFKTNLLTSTTPIRPTNKGTTINSTAQQQLKERVRSIEETLEKYGKKDGFRGLQGTKEYSDYSSTTGCPACPVRITCDNKLHSPTSRHKKYHSHRPASRVQHGSPSRYSSGTVNGYEPLRGRSRSRKFQAYDDDDEEIADLFRELEELGLSGNGSFRRNKPRDPFLSLKAGDLSKTCTSSDHSLPRMFRCQGCGDMQNIFTPYNNQNLSNLDHQKYPFLPLGLQPYVDILDPSKKGKTLDPDTTAKLYAANVAAWPWNSPNNRYYMPYQPFSGGVPWGPFGFPNMDITKDERLNKILEKLSEKLEDKDKSGGGRPRSRSIGTQSVEDMRFDKSIEEEEELLMEEGTQGGLQSAVPNDELKLNWDQTPDDNNRMEDFMSGLPKTALELREMELSAWAASKWWGMVKKRRELRKHYGFDHDGDEEFCQVELRNRDTLQSAPEELDLSDSNPEQPDGTYENAKRHPGKDSAPMKIPKGFDSFKQLSAAAKASYKWSQFIEKRKSSRKRKEGKK